MSPQPRPLRAADLYVVLDKAYRRRARRCGKCGFSLPFPVFRGADEASGEWAVNPSESCAPECAQALEELVSRMQKEYRLEGREGPGLH